MSKLQVLGLLAALVGLQVGCMKSPTPNQDFGAEASSDTVIKTLAAASYESTFNSSTQIQKNEYVYTESTNQVESLMPITISLRADSITDVTLDANKDYVYTITRNLHQLDSSNNNMKAYPATQQSCNLYVSGGCDLSVSPVAAAVERTLGGWAHRKDAVPVGPTFGIGATHHKLSGITAQSLQKQAAEQTIRWTYHNLTKTYVQVALPALVNLRSDCGGRKNPCSTPLQAVQVTYDAVDWTTESQPVKYSYSLIMSPEVPYFSSLLMSCGTTTIPYANQRISVSQCEEVKDFSFGHN